VNIAPISEQTKGVTVNTGKSKTGQLSQKWLQRYVDMRARLNKEANAIHSITSLLAQFENLGDDTIKVDPVALGHVNRMMHDAVLNIWEILDDYMYILDAKLELERLESEG